MFVLREFDFEKLLDAAGRANGDELEKIGTAAASKLSVEQKNTIEKAIADPEYLKSVLSSPKAQEIIKKLQGGNK